MHSIIFLLLRVLNLHFTHYQKSTTFDHACQNCFGNLSGILTPAPALALGVGLGLGPGAGTGLGTGAGTGLGSGVGLGLGRGTGARRPVHKMLDFSIFWGIGPKR